MQTSAEGVSARLQFPIGIAPFGSKLEQPEATIQGTISVDYVNVGNTDLAEVMLVGQNCSTISCSCWQAQESPCINSSVRTHIPLPLKTVYTREETTCWVHPSDAAPAVPPNACM